MTADEELVSPNRVKGLDMSSVDENKQAGASEEDESIEHYPCHIPAEVVIGHGEDQKRYAVTIEDISDGGIRVHGHHIPDTEDRIKVHFVIPPGVMPEEYGKVHVRETVAIRRHQGDDYELEFEETLSHHLKRTVWLTVKMFAVVCAVLTTVVILTIKYENLYFFWFDAPLFLYSLAVGGYLLSRFLFASFYQRRPEIIYEPTVSVIIPIRNEEENIERTIRQIMESDYPPEKLQVIAINDHSTDRTLEILEGLHAAYPGLIVLNLQNASGKRKGLMAGVHISTGQVLVFVDSDSFLAPDAIRNLMPRMTLHKVAGVTGHCEVENEWPNILTRMQAVRYFIGFRVMKAAESVFGTVTCLSGPLAAYHRKPLLEVMDEWGKQTWMGQEATFGDDRSLTNFLLRKGHRVLYEETAVCTTYVPEKFKTFMSQQLRWKKSWFRESLIACRFMWKREPLMALSFYTGFILPILAPIVVARAIFVNPIVFGISPWNYIFGVFLMSMLMSTTYLFIKRSRLWVYGIHFCFFYMFALVWQLPWAILTSGNNKWGTRHEVTQ
jgi:hyaluronan synthase